MTSDALGEERLLADLVKGGLFQEEQRNILRKSSSSTESVPLPMTVETDNNQKDYQCSYCKRREHKVNYRWEKYPYSCAANMQSSANELKKSKMRGYPEKKPQKRLLMTLYFYLAAIEYVLRLERLAPTIYLPLH